MKNQRILELYTDDNKSKYSSNSMNIIKSAKKKKKMKIYTKWPSKVATTYFVWKITNRKKMSYEHFNLCEVEIFLDEIIKQRHAKLLEKRK